MFDKLKKLFASPASEEQNTEVFKKQKLSPTEEMILEDDHIWQHKLWRRWVMAQMFHMMMWVGKPLSEENYDKKLRIRGYGYAGRVMKNEMAMQKLLRENNDLEELEERNRWFTPELYSEIRSYKGGWYSFKESACYEIWSNAFKGTGAYFTMKNLILFHGCRIHLGEQVLGKDESFGYMKQTAFNDETTGKEMFAMMMKLISDNNYFYSSRKSY